MIKGDVDKALIKAIDKYAYTIKGFNDYDIIIKEAQDKQFVLIGEASHGTKEFYRTRAEITKRLVTELGFDAVAIEADWPDAYTVNRYVSSFLSDINAEVSLRDFERFPTWMWRNKEVVKFIEWLYVYNNEYNMLRPEEMRSVGFYGLDLYSLNKSVSAVINYLDKIDPNAAKQAKIRYSCLDHFMDNPQSYGYATELNLIESCKQEIVNQLTELRNSSYKYMKANGFVAQDEYFYAEQNAKLIRNAEEYYRAMFRGRPDSWNIRDRHMYETMESLTDHLSKQLDRDAKIVVWAHNSHIGNASATEMASRGEINIGQMVRHNHKGKSLLIGFSTCTGTVTAASDWDSPTQNKKISFPIVGSYEEIFSRAREKQFLLNLMEDNDAVDLLRTQRLQRAIGVIYRPETERYSHYFYTCLPEQFDFMIHYNATNAVEPLPTKSIESHGEIDETYPTGL